MSFCVIRNLSPGPRDYPLVDGSSIYLGAKDSSTSVIRIQAKNISQVLKDAEEKELITIEYSDLDDMNFCIVRNLTSEPVDYTLADGSNITLGINGDPSSVAVIPTENISQFLKDAENEGLIAIEYAEPETKFCIIRNLSSGPRDYPLTDGSSIYLGSKGSASATASINPDKISKALRTAEEKGLIAIEYPKEVDA